MSSLSIIDTMSSNNLSTQEKILQATWQQLDGKKATDVRMVDIAKAAGITRQALYLHYVSRAELLIATTQYIDHVKDVDERFRASCNAKDGIDRLEKFIDAWGNYIPEVYSIAKALLAVRETDEAAAQAWDDRMQAVRDGCEAVIKDLYADGHLNASFNKVQATDILWTLLSIRNWEQFRLECGWSQKKYLSHMKEHTKRVLVDFT